MTRGINLSAVASQLQGRQGIDPKLFSVITQIASELETLKNPISREIRPDIPSGDPDVPTDLPPLNPGQFDVEYTSTNVIIRWGKVDGADLYDVREGSDWDTAEQVALTPTAFIVLNPVHVGTHTYLVGTRNSLGEESETQSEVEFIIPPIGYISVSVTVIDNNVRLTWTRPPSTFEIDYYRIRRTFDGETTLVGRVSANFISYFENTAGSYSYSITPVDIAGNHGPEIIEDVVLENPSDFEVVEEIDLLTSENLVSGGAFNAYVNPDGSLLASVHTTETWAEHFVRGQATTIQGLIDRGNNVWCEPRYMTTLYTPRPFSTSYSNVIIEFNSVIRSITPPLNIFYGFSGHLSGKRLFVPSVTTDSIPIFNVGGIAGNGIVEVLSLSVSVIVKKAQDSGKINASSTDTDGTLVTFNRDYKNAPDVTVTVIDPSGFFATINSITADNFKVKVFDTDGNRATKEIEWLARGII